MVMGDPGRERWGTDGLYISSSIYVLATEGYGSVLDIEIHAC